MGSVLRTTGAAAMLLPTGLRVQLPPASVPSREDVMQELQYEPVPHRALKELRRYDKYLQT